MTGMPTRVVRLGRVLDLRVEANGKIATLSWQAVHALSADTTRRRLWLYPVKAEKKTKLEDGEFDELAKVYREWKSFPPSGVTRRKVRMGAPAFRGRVLAIGYRSDKWTGEPKSYEHHFEKPPRLTKLGDVYRISGGRLRVTPRGIVG